MDWHLDIKEEAWRLLQKHAGASKHLHTIPDSNLDCILYHTQTGVQIYDFIPLKQINMFRLCGHCISEVKSNLPSQGLKYTELLKMEICPEKYVVRQMKLIHLVCVHSTTAGFVPYWL